MLVVQVHVRRPRLRIIIVHAGEEEGGERETENGKILRLVGRQTDRQAVVSAAGCREGR